MERITINLTGMVRHDRMDGKEYLVAPMVMLVEGVLNGSNGPLLYPKEEITKTPVVWNHKPIVVYHPQENGQGVTACQPAVIETQGIGLIMNTDYDTNKDGVIRLKSEAWIDKEKANKIDPRIIKNVEAGKMMELSTGLFTDNEIKEGEFQGKKYSGIARNYRPDHLAILPDQVGACSIKDGAGLLRNSRKETGSMTQKEILVNRLITENSTWGEEDRDFLMKQNESRLKGFLAQNDVSRGGDIKGGSTRARDENTVEAERKKKEIQDDANTGEVDADETEDEANDLEMSPRRKGAKGPMANKADKKAKTVANKGSSEHSAGEGDDADETATMQDESLDGKKGGSKKPQDNQEAKPVTMEQYLAQAPEPIRNLLQGGLKAALDQKKALVAKITANHANTFSEQFLMTKDVEELEALAALAASHSEERFKPAAIARNFAGQGEPVSRTAQIDFAPLIAPTMNFEKEEKE